VKEFAAKEKLEIALSASASRLRTASVGQARRGGRNSSHTPLPPAEPREFRSDIFKQTPHLMLKNPLVKNILSALAVAGGGFILLNLTFLFDFFFQSLIDWFIKLFIAVDINRAWQWYPPLKHFLFVFVIAIISWFVFKSKLKTLYKAIYMTVPLAVVFVSIGIFFYRTPLVAYFLGGLITFGLLYHFYRTKKPWLYYYTVILVALTLAIFSLMGGEI